MQQTTKPSQVMLPKNVEFSNRWKPDATSLECSFQDEVSLKITVPWMTMQVHRDGQVTTWEPRLQSVLMDRKSSDSHRLLGLPLCNLFYHFYPNIARHIKSPVTLQRLAFLPSRHRGHFGGDNFHSCNQSWAILIAFLITCFRMPIISSAPRKHMQLAN